MQVRTGEDLKLEANIINIVESPPSHIKKVFLLQFAQKHSQIFGVCYPFFWV